MADQVTINRILAAVGFGDWTPAVLQTASGLAAFYDADITAMFAEQFAPPVYFSNQKMAMELKARREAARAHLQKCVGDNVSTPDAVDVMVVEMPPVDAIVHTVDEVRADLLVMGPHKRRGLKRFMLGAVPEAVFRWVDIPILTVRSRETGSEAGFRKILCPVNFTPVAMDALLFAADLAVRNGAELEVMSCVEEEGFSGKLSAYERRLEDWVPDEIQARCALNTEVRKGEAAAEIVKRVRDTGHDLVVIGAQRSPLLEATIYGTTSIRTMRWAPCSVLTVTRR